MARGVLMKDGSYGVFDWFACSCGLMFVAYDERGVLDKLLNMYEGSLAHCPDCGEECISNSTVTYGNPPSEWEPGEG